MSGHTPGPWKLAPCSHGGLIVERPGQNLQVVPEADARLMAAAPDLLAALEGLFEHCAMIHRHWRDGDNTKQANAAEAAARAAIQKARGEA